MVVRRLGVMLLCSALVAHRGLAQQPAAPAPWQRSWEAFVDAINRCYEDAKCDKKQFVGKEVVWEGVADSVDLGGMGIRMDMGVRRPRGMVDGTAKDADIIGFILKPEATEQDTWKSVVKGQRVRFKTKLGSTGRPDTPTSWTMIRTSLVCFIQSSGGELLQVLLGR
jgi:hypothetical protein